MDKLPRRRKRKPSPMDKFNRSTRVIIYKALKARLPIHRACELANVNRSTFRDWMKKGESPRRYPKHATFRRTVTQIEAIKEQEALKVIELAQYGGQEIVETKIHIGGKYGREITRTRKQLKPHWGAAAWWLEKTKPEDYGGEQIGDTNQTPEELAREIREAMQAMDESVPDEDCCLEEIQSCEA